MTLPDIHEQVSDLKGVLDVARQLGATTDLRTMLTYIERAARSVMDCERASVFLYDEAADELYGYVATGVEGLRISAKRGIAGQAVRDRRTINVPDAYADPRFNPRVDMETGFRTRNILTLPLIGLNDRVVGALQMLNSQRGAFTEWDERLAETLAAQAGAAVQRQTLLDQYAEKLKLEHDLSVARLIQQQLLPDQPPTVDGFDIAGWNKPADQTGGDAFDFMQLDTGQLAITIADATGHGIGPALVIAECRALLRATVCFSSDPEQIVSRVNSLLVKDLPMGRFVTCFFGLLDPAESVLHYSSAGHAPILYLRAAGDEIVDLPANGIPLGIMPDMALVASEPIGFQPGDLLVVVTDGFFEWMGPDQQQFGIDRLTEVIRRNRDRPATELIRILYESVLQFGKGTDQQDDLTAIVIKRNPADC
jgi:sigma-B regulation protein RsbU (phosphoserine phosphatase)